MKKIMIIGLLVCGMASQNVYAYTFKANIDWNEVAELNGAESGSEHMQPIIQKYVKEEFPEATMQKEDQKASEVVMEAGLATEQSEQIIDMPDSMAQQDAFEEDTTATHESHPSLGLIDEGISSGNELEQAPQTSLTTSGVAPDGDTVEEHGSVGYADPYVGYNQQEIGDEGYGNEGYYLAL